MVCAACEKYKKISGYYLICPNSLKLRRLCVDCARTCVRLGFNDVNIVYRRSREEMPAIGEEVAEAADRIGIDYECLIDKIVHLALRRYA